MEFIEEKELKSKLFELGVVALVYIITPIFMLGLFIFDNKNVYNYS